MPKVDQRIRAALRIQRRTTGFDKAHAQVEADRLLILLIDVCAQLWMLGQCVLQQLPADPGATYVRIDEQRFHVRAVDQHEAQRPILCIDSNGHRRLRQETGDFGIDRQAIFSAEEVVGGVDGAAPEIDKGGAVVSARGTEGDHVFTKVLAGMRSMKLSGRACRCGFIRRCDGG